MPKGSIAASSSQPEHKGKDHLLASTAQALAQAALQWKEPALHMPLSLFPPNTYFPNPTNQTGSLGLTESGFGFWLNLLEQSQQERKVVSCLVEAGQWETPCGRGIKPFSSSSPVCAGTSACAYCNTWRAKDFKSKTKVLFQSPNLSFLFSVSASKMKPWSFISNTLVFLC